MPSRPSASASAGRSIAESGRTIVSHQIDGWQDFPLGDWCRQTLGRPAVLGNDSDLAGLGEARFGAGRGHRIVFYSNVGSGIGGSLVVDGELYRGGRGVASEIGHLRPGLECSRTHRRSSRSPAAGRLPRRCRGGRATRSWPEGTRRP